MSLFAKDVSFWLSVPCSTTYLFENHGCLEKSSVSGEGKHNSQFQESREGRSRELQVSGPHPG